MAHERVEEKRVLEEVVFRGWMVTRLGRRIRTGRANPGLLEGLTVDYYGAATPLKSLATLSTPDSQPKPSQIV